MDPYKAFRPRLEEKLKKKSRKNDLTSYLKMKELRQEMERARTVLEMLKKREKLKKDYMYFLELVFDAKLADIRENVRLNLKTYRTNYIRETFHSNENQRNQRNGKLHLLKKMSLEIHMEYQMEYLECLLNLLLKILFQKTKNFNNFWLRNHHRGLPQRIYISRRFCFITKSLIYYLGYKILCT